MFDLFNELADPPNLLAWGLVNATGVAAGVSAAALTVPAVQKFLYPPPEERRLRDHVLLDMVLEDNVTVRCTTGDLFQVVALDGIDLSARPFEQQAKFHRDRKIWLESLNNFPGLAPVRVITRRTHENYEADVDLYPNPEVQAVMRSWYASFRKAYRNRHFLILSVKGGTERARTTLNDAMRETLDKLADFRPRILGLGRKDSGEASPLLSFLGGMLAPGMDVQIAPNRGTPITIDGGRRHVGPLNKRLADRLVFARVHFHRGRDRGIFTIVDGPDEIWCGMVGVSTWGDGSSSDILAQVLAVDAEMTVIQWLEVKDPARMLTSLGTRFEREIGGQVQGFLNRFGISNDTLNQYQAAMTMLKKQGGEHSDFCLHELAILVTAPSRDDLERRIAAVRRAFDAFRTKALRCRGEAPWLWLSQMPPHKSDAWGRCCELTTDNVADFISFETPTQGFTRCDWGPRPVTLFRTSSGSPFGFTWHASERDQAAGHTLIIGATESGKTTFQNFTGIASLAYKDARIFMFDSFDGSYVPVRAFGGSYLYLQTDVEGLDPSSRCELNPLQMDIQPDAVEGDTKFLISWLLEHVCETTDIESETAVSRAVRDLARIPKKDRRLGDIYAALPDNIPAKAPLRRFVAGGEYAHLYNSARDTLSFGSSRLVAFDFTRILDNQIACRTLLPYLSYRIETEMQRYNAPWLMLFDEARHMFTNAALREWGGKKLPFQARKARGVVVYAFQQVSSLREAGVADVLVEQCPTKIFFPNESANPADYIDMLGLTPAEFSIIKREAPVAKALNRFVLLKRQGEGSVVLDVDLKEALGRRLDLFASGRLPADRFRRFEHEEGSIERAAARFIQS